MAEIEIERKSGMAWLWWVLGLALLALLAWLLFAGGDDDDVAVVDPMVTDTAAMVAPMGAVDTGMAGMAVQGGPAVQEYMNTCAPAQPTEMGLDHAYTSDCLNRLVAAVETVLQSPSVTGVNAQAELTTARQAAERLAQSQVGAEHSRMTQEAFTAVAALVNRIQDDRFPALDSQATQMEQTATSISPGQPLLNQRESVQQFFRQAGAVLNGMTAAG